MTFANCSQYGQDGFIILVMLLAMRLHFSIVFCYPVQAIRTGWVHPNIILENPDQGVVCLPLLQCSFISDGVC